MIRFARKPSIARQAIAKQFAERGIHYLWLAISGYNLLQRLNTKAGIPCPAGDWNNHREGNVLESRQVKTVRVTQSIIATKYKKPFLTGM
jgi:hypothetical protein